MTNNDATSLSTYADRVAWLQAAPQPSEHSATCADRCLDLHVAADDLELEGLSASPGTVPIRTVLVAGFEADRRARQWADCARAHAHSVPALPGSTS